MKNTTGNAEIALGSWIAAFAIATVAGTMLMFLGGWGFLQGAFVGLVLFVILGVLFSWVMMRPLPAPNEAVLVTPEIAQKTPGDKATSTKVEPANAPPVKADPISVAPAPTVPKVQPSKRLKGEEAVASSTGAWKYENPEAAKKAPAKKATPKKKAPAATADDRPTMMLDAPESGQADDLKKISGVGPKLEQTLNELGIWHYHQVAAFKKKDIAWVDERLRFKGRIERDDWVGQAKKLAKS